MKPSCLACKENTCGASADQMWGSRRRVDRKYGLWHVVGRRKPGGTGRNARGPALAAASQRAEARALREAAES